MHIGLDHLLREEKGNKKEREQEVSRGRVSEGAEVKLMHA